ncbi:hypothetical protein F2P81_018943 [Scophthalmus maximus]|uniref:Uncharacterized protein n=1 Tax=Scophthalmus maximus TaxID=52904 RepID=A0A6A4SC14_SCOMX|nr:hypothetical protein F2P81_018943 [Scophthalmus maximus]
MIECATAYVEERKKIRLKVVKYSQALQVAGNIVVCGLPVDRLVDVTSSDQILVGWTVGEKRYDPGDNTSLGLRLISPQTDKGDPESGEHVEVRVAARTTRFGRENCLLCCKSKAQRVVSQSGATHELFFLDRGGVVVGLYIAPHPCEILMEPK